jgi:hypothetical protein
MAALSRLAAAACVLTAFGCNERVEERHPLGPSPSATAAAGAGGQWTEPDARWDATPAEAGRPQRTDCGSPEHAHDELLSWEGWSLHPGLPCGCRGVYVPDSVAKRVPPLAWVPCEDAPCKRLDVSGWSTKKGGRLGLGFDAAGGGPEHVIITRMIGDAIVEPAVYDFSGAPLAAWRLDAWERSAWAASPVFTADGKSTVIALSELLYCTDQVSEATTLASVGNLNPLMYSETPTIRWTPEFLHGRYVQHLIASTELIVPKLVGTIAAADVKTKVLTDIAKPPLLDGDWIPLVVLGRTIWLWRFAPYGRGEVWVSSDVQPPKPVIRFSSGSVIGFATDGVHLVWSEGTELDDTSAFVKYSRHEAFIAPYTTDPAKIVRKSLGTFKLAWAQLRMANGYVAGGSMEDGFVAVLRLKDLAWLRFDKPKGWFLKSVGPYPAKDELWLRPYIGTPSGTLDTLVRVPYAALAPLSPGGP